MKKIFISFLYITISLITLVSCSSKDNSDSLKAESGGACDFKAVVQSVIDKGAMTQSRGILFDADSDGKKELAVVYAFNGENECSWELWDDVNSNTPLNKGKIPFCDDKNYGCLGRQSYGNYDFFCVYSEEASGGYKTGSYLMYDLTESKNKEVHILDFKIKYSTENSGVEYKSSKFFLDKKEISNKDYQTVTTGFKELISASKNSNSESSSQLQDEGAKAMPLNELLSEIEKTNN